MTTQWMLVLCVMVSVNAVLFDDHVDCLESGIVPFLLHVGNAHDLSMT